MNLLVGLWFLTTLIQLLTPYKLFCDPKLAVQNVTWQRNIDPLSNTNIISSSNLLYLFSSTNVPSSRSKSSCMPACMTDIPTGSQLGMQGLKVHGIIFKNYVFCFIWESSIQRCRPRFEIWIEMVKLFGCTK